MSTPINTPPANPFHDPFDAVVMTEESKETKESSNVSADASRPQSAAGGRAKEKKRVGWSGGTDGTTSPTDLSRRESWNAARSLSPKNFSPQAGSPEASGRSTPSMSGHHSRDASAEELLPRSDSKSHLPELSQQQSQQLHQALNSTLNVPARPRPAIRRTGSAQSAISVDIEDEIEDADEDREAAYRRLRAQEAFQRGKRLEHDERLQSEPSSRRGSPERPLRNQYPVPSMGDDIPLQDLGLHRNGYDTDSDDEDLPELDKSQKKHASEAHKLVRKHTQRLGGNTLQQEASSASGVRSGATTPTEDQSFMEDYRPAPEHYRGGILGALLKLYNQNEGQSKKHHRRSPSGDTSWSGTPTPQHSPPMSGASTPVGGQSNRHWYSPKHKTQSTSSLAQLIGSSASLSSPAVGLGQHVQEQLEEQRKRPTIGKRSRSGGAARAALNRLSRPKLEDEIRITVHIAETISRQKYLMRLCRCLMQYGAPTHRLEEYMVMSARVLEIDAQFLYIPGSMIMSFDDTSTHTTEVKMVKVPQGLDLGKLRDVHEVYKDVVHDRIGVEEATSRLKETSNKKNKHSRWVVIPVYGLASVCVGPFAFGANLIDLPVAFILGCILGTLQHVVAPRSDLYANVFEIAAAVITSFLARAFGSIPYNGGRLFCFSALAQSSIALILPGYTVLCASLELQSKSIVAGSVRMVYAIIYSLFLGFGITIGTAIYGMIDTNATSATTCPAPMEEYWFFFFVPGFTMCLIIVNQAKWKQAPTMMIIAFAGYITNYFSSRRFAGNTQIANTLGALVIGVMANLYSRIGARIENKLLDIWEGQLRHIVKRVRHLRDKRRNAGKPSFKSMEEGASSSPPASAATTAVDDADSTYISRKRRVGYGLAAAAMLPAIFVQVPSGLAVSGSLVSGIASADQITGNSTNGTQIVNPNEIGAHGGAELNSIALNVGYSVIMVSIGITVGLFLSAIVVYPFGKKRSGLFSF